MEIFFVLGRNEKAGCGWKAWGLCPMGDGIQNAYSLRSFAIFSPLGSSRQSARVMTFRKTTESK